MKLFNNNRRSMIFLAIFFFLMIIPQKPDKRERTPERLIISAGKNAAPGTAADPQMLIYTKVRDSLEKIVTWKENGLVKTPNLDFLDVARVNETIGPKPGFFFTVKGFVLQSNSDFVIDNDQYILESYKAKTGSGDIVGRAERKKINVRLGYGSPGDKGLTLMFPVSNGSYAWLKTIMDVLGWIFAIAVPVFFIFFPIRVLRNVSHGKPFLPENAKYLSWLGWGVLIFFLAKVLIPWLLSLVLSAGIPDEIYYPFWASLFDVKFGLLAGCAILITARAFKQGHRLQREQDLMI